jgi:pimeloyl-ACP methyl ester carboxylesterase
MAERDGLRIVGVDRPGIGRSTPHLYHSVYDSTRDIAVALDRLEIDRLAVVGLSGGGPYALALGHALPDRVVAVGVLGGVAPTVGPEAIGGGAIGFASHFRFAYPFIRRPLELAARNIIKVAGPFGSPAMDLFARFLPEGDRRTLADPEIKAMFLDDLIGNSATGIHAPLFDLMLFLRPWGFAVADIRVPVRWWHGDSDSIVPLAHGQHLVPFIPDAELHLRPGESHLGGLGAADEILTTLVGLWDAADDAADGAADAGTGSEVVTGGTTVVPRSTVASGPPTTDRSPGRRRPRVGSAD